MLFAKQHECYKNNRENIKNKCDNLSEHKKNKIKKYQKQWRRNLSEEDAIRRREYAKKWYCNLSEEEKNKKNHCSRERYQRLISVQ